MPKFINITRFSQPEQKLGSAQVRLLQGAMGLSKVSMKGSVLEGSDLPHTTAWSTKEKSGTSCVSKIRASRLSRHHLWQPPEAKFKASKLIFAHRGRFNTFSFTTHAGSPALKTRYTRKYVNCGKQKRRKSFWVQGTSSIAKNKSMLDTEHLLYITGGWPVVPNKPL